MLSKKKKWLQLSQRQRMSPFPNYMSMESITSEMKKVIGVSYKHVIIVLEENMMYVFMDQDDYGRVGKKVLKQVLHQPDIFLKLTKKQKQFGASFYKFLNANNKPNRLRKVSNSKLASLHEEYDRRYKEVYSNYFPILSVERFLFEYLRDYVNAREKDHKKAAKYVDRLITEKGAMVNWQENKAALKLCISIAKNNKWVGFFKRANAEELVKGDNKLSSIIKKHEQNWFWITRDYDDPVLIFSDFVARFKKHLAGNPQKSLNVMLKEEEQLKNDIQRISIKLKIDKKTQRLFQAMREGIYFKEYRKTVVSKTLYYYDPILLEIARRSGLSMRQARHLLIREVRPMLVKGVDMTHELNNRIKKSVYHCINGKARVYTGSQANEYYNHLIKVDKKAKVFYGMPVSAGVARGPVKIIINPDSFHKVKKGDVISTIQATPVFTHVLSIASALACDGGPGITSHPATLAREAGIPGVIGLRMGTRVFKDGQIVEVDGDKGVVRIIK